MTITNFEQYWDIVTSNDLWYDNIKIRHARKDIKGVAQEAFIDLLTQPNRLAIADPTDFQKHLGKFLMYAKEEIQKPQLQQEEIKPEPIDPNNPPLTGKARSEWLQKWYESLGGFKAERVLLDEQIEEIGEVDPPKKRGHIVEFDPEKQLQIKKELDERTRKGRELWFRDNHPNATEQEVINYLKSFE
jgi:hypothetical protein